MPYSVIKHLGIHELKPTKLSLVLAEKSVCLLVGNIVDLLVIIGNYFIPTNFLVLELDAEPNDHLILGCPFIAITGAIIDVKKGKINLHLNDITMKFGVDNMLKKPTIYGQTF